MQPQQQHMVVTGTGGVQPVYVAQPYQTSPVVNSYPRGLSTVIGVLLIIAGCLSIIFNIVDLAIGTQDKWTYGLHVSVYSLSTLSNGFRGHGFWCGIMVSVLFHFLRSAIL